MSVRIVVDENPCYGTREGCDEGYTRAHVCELDGGHAGRCRCICGKRYTPFAAPAPSGTPEDPESEKRDA